MKLCAALAALLCFLCACSSNKETTSVAKSIKSEPFGEIGGQKVMLYTLENSHGVTVHITNYGGRVVALETPDRDGNFADIVLGFDTLSGYERNNPYFGAIVGRYGNRIGNGEFTLDGKKYVLAKNDGANSLHGGLVGFDKRIWTPRETTAAGVPALELTYVSASGEEGYPGKLTATVTYSLNDNNELHLDYAATTDQNTVLNLTNHSYFNLDGQGSSTILDQVIMINADKFTPVNAGLIPTGEIRSVEGTPFDFRKPTPIGARINENNEQLKFGKGYDMNYVLNHPAGQLGLAARVTDPKNGRVLEVSTTQPGLQFYTGNFLDGTIKGKGGKPYAYRSAFCLETQHYPNSPNEPNFPSTELKPGERFTSTTVWHFTTDKAK